MVEHDVGKKGGMYVQVVTPATAARVEPTIAVKVDPQAGTAALGWKVNQIWA